MLLKFKAMEGKEKKIPDEGKVIVKAYLKELDKDLIQVELPSQINKAAKVSTGLGDSIEKAIKAVGANKLIPKNKDCGCEERKEKLNRFFPYSTDSNSKKWFECYLKRHNPAKFKKEDVFYLVRIYSRFFKKRVKVCTNCSDAINVMNEIVKRLKTELCQEEIKI